MSARFDLIAVDKSWVDIVLRLPTLPGYDQKVQAELVGRYPGGMGGNVVCAASQLGVRTGLVSWIGDDEDGQRVREDLQRFGVDTTHVRVNPGASTNFTVVLVAPSGEKALVIVPTTFDVLHLDTPMAAYLSSARIVYCAAYDLDQLAQVARVVRAAGGLVATDLEPVTVGDGETLARALRLVDIVFLNVEALHTDDPAQSARELCTQGPHVVAVTMGARGSLACTAEELVYRPAFSVPVVDTTGAGDCFAAAFLVAHLRGWLLSEALDYAQAAAALSLQAYGPRGHLPTDAEVRSFLSAQRERRWG